MDDDRATSCCTVELSPWWRANLLDRTTREHLEQWLTVQHHNDERDEVRDTILAHLASLDLEDLEYALQHGWWSVYDDARRVAREGTSTSF